MSILIAALFAAQTAMSVARPAAPAADPDRMICRTKPILGSRLSTGKVCKTATEWKAEANDRDQLRRDLGNVGRNDPANNY